MEIIKMDEHPTREEIKALRVEFDSIFRTLNGMVNDYAASPMFRNALNQAIIKSIEGKMWLGKCLEGMNSKLPKEYRDESNGI